MIDLKKPCVKCGGTSRYATGKCQACVRARTAARYASDPLRASLAMAAYRAANPEQEKLRVRAYREANKAKRNAANAVWRAENPEKVKSSQDAYHAKNPGKANKKSSDWREKNPAQVRIQRHNRRALVLSAGGSLSKGLLAKLFELQKGMCPCCKQPLGDKYHMDHVMPLALGGTNTDDNIQLLRATCNQKKHAKHPVDFMQAKGFLL